MPYLLLSALALAAFYVLYKWLLSRDTFHRFNRVVILVLLTVTTLFPFVAPYMHLHLGSAGSEMSIQLRELIVSPERVSQLESELPDASLLEAFTPYAAKQGGALLLVSLAVTAVFLFVLLYKLEGLRRRCSEHYEMLSDGTRLVLHDDDYAPFSWMRYVVCSRKDYAANGLTILAHEREHIRLHHSWDLLLAQVCCAVQWFNPAAWLLKRELQAVHEYEADEAMLREGCNAHTYQMKLIETALGARFSSIANNFTHITVKQRILMMTKNPSSPWARLKVLILVPVAAIALFVAACTNNEKPQTLSLDIDDADIAFILDGKIVSGEVYKAMEQDDIDRVEVFQSPESVQEFGAPFGLQDKKAIVDIHSKSADAGLLPRTNVIGYAPAGSGDGETSTGETQAAEQDGVLFDVCEEMPQYSGGMEGLMKYLASNIHYPEAAQKAKAEGRVLVQFIVEKDGSITEAKVIRSVEPSLDAEALRVVRSMPKWTPGKQRGEAVRVKFTLPIMFQLN